MNRHKSLIFIITIFGITICRGQNIGYKYGNDSLEKNISKYLMHDIMADLSTNTSKYVIAFFEVSPSGKIENITFTSFMDTSYSKYLYSALIRTSGDWVNTSGANVFFELPFQFMYTKDGGTIEKIPIINTNHYEDGKLIHVIKLKPQLTITYPSVN